MSSEDRSQPLTLKYRPRTFQDMVGQQAARVTLMQMIHTGRIPPALLLHGSWGSGKTTSARIVASALNCEAEEVEQRPCGKCPTCDEIVDSRSSDVIEIDAASSGLVEDVRELRQQVRFQPLRRFRVVILDEAHELTVKGQQALLKVLEEPPARVVFLLATTNPDRVLDTIASRCFSVRFHRITVSDIAKRLQYIAAQEGFLLSSELAMAIADRSQGALRDAVMLLDQCSLVGISTPDQLAMLLGDSNVSIRLIEAALKGDIGGAYACAQEGLESLPSPNDLVSRIVDTMRRLLVLASCQDGSSLPVLSPPATAAERALFAGLDPLRLIVGLRMVWEYYARVAPVTDSAASLNLFVFMLVQSLSGVTQVVSKSPVNSSSSVATGSSRTEGPKSTAGLSAPAATVDDILAMVQPPST